MARRSFFDAAPRRRPAWITLGALVACGPAASDPTPADGAAEATAPGEAAAPLQVIDRCEVEVAVVEAPGGGVSTVAWPSAWGPCVEGAWVRAGVGGLDPGWPAPGGPAPGGAAPRRVPAAEASARDEVRALQGRLRPMAGAAPGRVIPL